MAVAPIYELTIPAPYDTSFVNGEKALSVSATIAGTSGFGNYYLSKWFDFKGGLYQFRSVVEDGALWSVARTLHNARTIFTSAGAAVIDATIYIPPGRQRLDILLSNVSTAASRCFAAFTLVQDGKLVYGSDGDGWVFDTAPIDDADVPDLGDVRLSYPLFSVLPNWKDGVLERIEFKTEVFGSEADNEQRRSLRRYPRRSFEASFARHELKRARLENFLIGIGRDRLLVPTWTEGFPLAGTLGGTLTFPDDSLVMREFNAGDLVWVNAGNPNVGEILSIASIDLGTDTITFAAAPSLTWGAGSIVYPLRVARVLESTQMNLRTDRVATMSIRFWFDQPEKWPTAAWGDDQLFSFAVDRAAGIDVGHDRPTAWVDDNDVGLLDVLDIFAITRSNVRCSLTLFGRARLYAFRQFINMARGRAVRFWMPSNALDLVAKGNFSGTTLDVELCGLSEYISRTQDIRSMLAVVFNNGSATLYRRIEDVEPISGGERLTLDSALPSILKANVERLMFVLPARFDQDSFEILHHVNDSAAWQIGVAIRSADADDLPDIG